jgi:hypothetical protein
MNALKSLANPTPGRSLVVYYLTRFTTRELQTAKNPQQIKSRLQIFANQWAKTKFHSDMSRKCRAGSNRIMVFSNHQNSTAGVRFRCNWSIIGMGSLGIEVQCLLAPRLRPDAAMENHP